MVNYRLIDYKKDRQAVIDLLNQNLTPRNTREFFEWKYMNYPGGSSTGAVAEINDKIVAVVFYLPFDFYNNQKTIKAARPVGGCTDPKYRGKGIFKKLMKFCLDSYSKEYKFLFANPNRFSYPEFLKMGWKEVEGYEYRLGIIFPWSQKNNLTFQPFTEKELLNEVKISHQDYISAGTLEFIKWRYTDQRYFVKIFKVEKGENFIVYRTSTVKRMKCIILCDYIGAEQYINAAIKKVCREEKTLLVYYLKNNTTNKINFVFDIKHHKVVITFTENETDIIKKIRFSLGDVEGTV